MLRRLCPLLLLAALVASTGATFAQGPAPGRSDFGVNSHIASRLPDPGPAADILAATSAGWAREDFHWAWIEPRPGRFEWGIYDRAIGRLAATGVNIIGVLGVPPAWSTPSPEDADGRPSFYAPDPARYAAFAAAVVARYKDRVRHWQIWNEPENPLYWRPRPDPAAYAALLKAAYPAIKAADPGATVISGGVVPTHVGFVRALAEQGAWGSFDVLAVHPYVDPYGPEEGQIAAGDVAAVRTLVEGLGRKPIWATEFGWASSPADRDPRGVDEELQASYLVRSAVLLRAAGVERVIWYKLKDDEARDGRVHNGYGLLRFAGGRGDLSQPKPALVAFRTLNQQLAGAAPVGQLDLGARQVLLDFEEFGAWRRGDQANGTFGPERGRVYGGAAAARLDYRFPGRGNDYVVFTARQRVPIPGSPGRLGVWVAGDGSGHALKVWLRDAQGEVLQFRLGFVGGGEWAFLSAPLTGEVEPYNRISGQGNRRLDFPASLAALVLDDEPDAAGGAGTVLLDDLTVVSGPDAYAVRFSRGAELVDVLWAPGAARVSLAAGAGPATLVDRWGTATPAPVTDGQVTLDLGPSPVFFVHGP